MTTQQSYPVRVDARLDATSAGGSGWSSGCSRSPTSWCWRSCGWRSGPVAGRAGRDPVHRPLPTIDLRLQRRRAALDLAGHLLHVRRSRHRPVPAVQPTRRPHFPAHLAVTYPDHLSRGLVLVKWWLLAIPHYLVLAHLRRRRSGTPPRATGRARLEPGADRAAGVRGRRRPALHRQLPAEHLRPRPRAEPLGAAGRGVRLADDRRLPAVPPRHGRQRPGHARPGTRPDDAKRPWLGAAGSAAKRLDSRPGSSAWLWERSRRVTVLSV